MTTPIAEMQAGPEMDARVAEVVFGCKPEKDKDFSGESFCLCAKCDPDKDGMGSWVSDYSTDIAAAWTVVEKMSSKFEADALVTGELKVMGVYRSCGQWACEIMTTHPDGDAPYVMNAWGETAPLAICKAALMAMEREKG